MAEDFVSLLSALAGLEPAQFSVISLGLDVFILTGFLALARPQFFGFNSRSFSAIIWALTWCCTQNAVANWHHLCTSRHTNG